MRIDASQVLGQGGVKIKMGSGSATDSLREGDVVRAGVLSSDRNGTVTLKLEGGQSFSAKLGTDIKLSPGDVILLEVTAKDKNQISLSFSGVETAEDDLSLGQTNLVRDFTDKSLAPYASKLAELNMPVTEEAARMMRNILAQNPGLSFDEAAFLASNKLTGDANLMRAALETLAGGDKTDAMITRLMSLVNEQTSLTDLESGIRNPELGYDGSKLENAFSSGDKSSPFTVSTANSAPLTELVTTLVKSFSGVSANSGQGEAMPTTITHGIISQTDINMQINAKNAQNFLLKEDSTVIQQGADAAKSSNMPLVAAGERVVAATVETSVASVLSELPEGDAAGKTTAAGAQPVLGNATGAGVGTTAGAGVGTTAGAVTGAGVGVGTTAAVVTTAAVTTGAATETAAGVTTETAVGAANTSASNQSAQLSAAAQTTQTMSNVVAQLLSNIPEFSGTPQAALKRFSEMLLRVAGDSPETANSTDALLAQLDKLFTKIGRDDADAGTRLRDARQELYTRLALIEEAISRAAQPARAEMLVQTQKLMDHVRLLNSIDQFVYMQMPVQLSEERKTADLYVFKRKGGKRADPDNVNILLAIDLEFMGHWEALVNIKNKEVSIQMEVPGEAEKEHFNSNSVLLHNMLQEAGFKLVSTNIKVTEEETTPLTALSTFDRYTGAKQGIIDFMI